MPAAEEKNRQQAAQDNHVDVLPEKIEGKPHAAVFGMIAGHQFVLRLGQVKRQPFRFGQGADQKNDERNRLHQQKREPGLGRDDIHQAEGAGQHDDRDQGQAHGQLIADHLGRAAQPAQHTEGGIGGPAAQHHAIDAEGGKRQDIEQPHIEIADHQRYGAVSQVQIRTKGHHGKQQQRHDGHYGRSQQEDEAVGPGRYGIFLEQQLDAIGQRLPDSCRTNPVGTGPQLEPAEQFAFHQHQVGGAGHQRHQHDNHLGEQDEQVGYIHTFSIMAQLREYCSARRCSSSWLTTAGRRLAAWPWA